MKNTKGYEINFETKEIIITKAFQKAAGIVNTDEYRDLVTLRKDFGDFAIKVKTIEKKENKVSYNGLSVYKMKAAISYITNNEEAVKLFEKYVEVYKGQKGKYATLKKLFLDKYKEEYNALNATDMVEIDRLVKEFEEAEKAAETTKAA